MNTQTIGICSDHAGYETKVFLIDFFKRNNIEYKDYGCESTESCDYPTYAHSLASGIEQGKHSKGIAICGSGNGMAIALNKHAAVRAVLCWTQELAELGRGHNDANVLVLPGRFISNEEAEAITNTFLNSPYEGGRHQRRIDAIAI